MRKKIAAALMAAVLAFLYTANGFASGLDSESAQGDPPTRLSYIDFTFTDLLINSSGKATATAVVEGYSSITTRIKIEMTLQKRFLLLFWTDEATWTETFPTYYGSLVKSTNVSGGTYRVQAVYTAYSGSASETLTATTGATSYHPCVPARKCPAHQTAGHLCCPQIALR